MSDSATSANAFAMAASKPDIVDTHLEDDVSKFLQIPYLLAKCVLQLARNTRVYHVLAVYIARQALRLVLVLNSAVIDGKPAEGQLKERDILRDELLELDKSMSTWSLPSTTVQSEVLEREIKQLYDRFFAVRFYFGKPEDQGYHESAFQRLRSYDREAMNVSTSSDTQHSDANNNRTPVADFGNREDLDSATSSYQRAVNLEPDPSPIQCQDLQLSEEFKASVASSSIIDPTSARHNEAADPRPPSLFALLIGINKYKHHPKVPNLYGAVPDAEAVRHYLEGSLGVHPSHIKPLYNEEATGQAIVKELRLLEEDIRIQKGDAIIIFYAGHGAEAEPPISWHTGGQNIQLLAPHDFEQVGDATVIALTDRTIGTLLDRIAHEKGDNITVIFDCCHSGGLARDPTSLVGIRGIGTVNPISADLEPSLLSESHHRNPSVAFAPGFLRKGLRSHVLLAACKATETARELPGLKRGAFTMALIKTLAAVGEEKVSYAELVRRIPLLPLQNPQCEGHDRDRICFDSKATGQDRDWYRVQKMGHDYVMNAGVAHGITEGALFAVFKERISDLVSLPLAEMTTCAIGTFTTSLAVTSGDAQFTEGYALQIRTGKEGGLRIHITEEEATKEKLQCVVQALEKITDCDPTQPRFLRVHKEKAQVDISFDKGQIMVNILDPRINGHGLHQAVEPIQPTIKHASEVLIAASQYYRHLDYTGKVGATGPLDEIEIEFTKLKLQRDDDGTLALKPIGRNLIKDGVVEIIVNEARYGIRINNKSDVPLYPYVFFFDSSDFAITQYFHPPMAVGEVEHPLPAKKSLPIGYGSSGTGPMYYELSEGQDIDVKFLKVFLSSRYVDMSNFGQQIRKAYEDSVWIEKKPSDVWGSLLITVVQRRHARPTPALGI